jgi:predicted thioredoxin/glutaredoxin
VAITIGRGRRRRQRVVVYTRERCGLCRRAEEIVAREAGRAEVRLIDIDADPDLQRRFHVRVPVVEVDGSEVAEGVVQPGSIRRALRRARGGRWVDWRDA